MKTYISFGFLVRATRLPLLFLLPLAPVRAQSPADAASLEQFSRSMQFLTARVSPCVVRILVTRYSGQEESGRTDVAARKQQSIGSGVIVDPDGYILTNAHVVDGAQKIKVDLVSDGEQTIPGVLARSSSLPEDASLVGVFKEGDIALIKIAKTGLPALPFADYGKLRQGQVVLAFGSPAGLQNSVSMGVVSSIARQPDPDSPFLYIQTDTPINPGNSGGPLVNTAGEIVGLNTFILSQSGGNEGVGFAVPSMLLKWVLVNLRNHGHVHRSSVGIGIQAVTPVLAAALKLPRGFGVILSDVVAGGPAAAAGLQQGDVLVSVDGRPIDSVPAMMGFFFEHGAGEHIQFIVLRGAERLTVEVVPVESPREPERLADLANPNKDVVAKLGVLGVSVNERTEEITGPLRLNSGVVVAARLPALLNVDTGLQANDVIHGINGAPISNLDALKSAVTSLQPGDPVAIVVERHGQFIFVAFTSE